MTWQESWQQGRNRVLILYIFACALLFIFWLPLFFNFIQHKPGTSINDPVLAWLPGHDLSVPIFLLIYGTIIATVVIHFSRADVIILSLATYCTVSLLRIVTIYLITLEPPSGIIILHDPFVSLIAYDTSSFAKDLFFSGHVSTLLSITFTEPKTTFRRIKIAITVAVGMMLLIQHIHYSIDVMAAPFFTFAAYQLSRRALLKSQNFPR